MPKRGFNTDAVQAGELRDSHIGSVVTPIFQASTFQYPNADPGALQDRIRSEPFLYSRWNNPTTQSAELKYSALEAAEYALAFSSGMGAIMSAILSFSRKNRRILSVDELYGQTHGAFEKTLPDFGVKADFITMDQLNSGEFRCSGYDLVYTESIVNPTMKVSDIKLAAKICRENSIPLFVDATFASPYNQRPLELGASTVLHSATKYISGHSDAIYGLAAFSNNTDFNETQNLRRTLGSIPDAFQSYLVLRGMKTLGLRMEKHNANGMIISKALSAEPKVISVNYPGLEESPYREIASRNLGGFGGMISFELKSGLEGARKFMKRLKISMVASSLGGVESLVSMPIETSHKSIPSGRRKKMGISDGLIRFSAGIEDAQDLINDMQEALSGI